MGYTVYVNNKNSEIERYTINGKILCSILDSIDRQLTQFDYDNTNNITHINYDSQWKKYFFEFSQLRFNYSNDYFEVLETKIETIDRINRDISKENYINAAYKFRNYTMHQKTSLNNFNIIEVTMNLKLNAYGYKHNVLPWNYDEKLKGRIEDYSNKYFYVIENWIYNYLINSGKNEVTMNDFKPKLIDFLLLNKKLKELCPSPYDRRIIVNIILDASILMKQNEKSRISYIWGVYSLKNNDR